MKLTISQRNKTHRAMGCAVHGLEFRDLRRKDRTGSRKKTLLGPRRRAHGGFSPLAWFRSSLSEQITNKRTLRSG